MTSSSPVVRQFGGLASGRLMAAALSFVWLAVAARELTIGEFADLALLLSVGSMVGVIADWGWPILLNEAVAADPRRAAASARFVLARRTRLASIAAVGVAVMYLAAAQDRAVVVPAIFAISVLASAGYTTFTAALRGLGHVGPDAGNEVASRVILLGVGFVLLHSGGGLITAVVVISAVDVASLLVTGAIARRLLPSDEPVDRARFTLSRVGPLGLASLVGLVYYRIDVWLLALLRPDSEVARYSLSFRILDGLAIPAGALAMVAVGATATMDRTAALRRSDRMIAWLALALLPAIVALLATPERVLGIAFGSEYEQAAPVLRLLTLAAIPTVAYLVWSPLVGLRGRNLLPIMLASLLINLGLNAVLIPTYGDQGAAVATIIGQTGLAVSMRLSLRERGTPSP